MTPDEIVAELDRRREALQHITRTVAQLRKRVLGLQLGAGALAHFTAHERYWTL